MAQQQERERVEREKQREARKMEMEARRMELEAEEVRQGPRSRGGGRGSTCPPPNIFKIIKI